MTKPKLRSDQYEKLLSIANGEYSWAECNPHDLSLVAAWIAESVQNREVSSDASEHLRTIKSMVHQWAFAVSEEGKASRDRLLEEARVGRGSIMPKELRIPDPLVDHIETLSYDSETLSEVSQRVEDICAALET